MGWRFTDAVDEYADRVRDVLAAEPERHTVALTVMEAVRGGQRWSDAPMHFGWWEEAGVVHGAVSLTPPFPLLLTLVPPGSVDGLVAALRERGAPVSGVNGERDLAEEVARRWCAANGLRAATAMEQRLYRLDRLVPPDPPPPGAARRASAADLDLVVGWFGDFHAEAEPSAGPSDLAGLVRGRVEAGLVWLWEDGGAPVAMAGRNPTAAGVARVGPVYTPPARRRRGYGAAVTAACTGDALDRGAAGVVLFTDLANPTSNAIYQAIGYRPVRDRVVLRFEPAGVTGNRSNG